jgi:hypothetical protein
MSYLCIPQQQLFSLLFRYSFLEYVAGGCQLRLAIAIDFTASNGDPAVHRRPPAYARIARCQKNK